MKFRRWAKIVYKRKVINANILISLATWDILLVFFSYLEMIEKQILHVQIIWEMKDNRATLFFYFLFCSVGRSVGWLWLSAVHSGHIHKCSNLLFSISFSLGPFFVGWLPLKLLMNHQFSPAQISFQVPSFMTTTPIHSCQWNILFNKFIL